MDFLFILKSPGNFHKCFNHIFPPRYRATEGRCIFSSGSPFPPYRITSSLSLQPGLANSMYISPAIALAALTCHACHIRNEMFLIAAETLASEKGYFTLSKIISSMTLIFFQVVSHVTN